MQVLLRNAKQMLNVVTTAFGETLFVKAAGTCSSSSSDIERLACRWHGISVTAQTFTAESALDEAWVAETTDVSTPLRYLDSASPANRWI